MCVTETYTLNNIKLLTMEWRLAEKGVAGARVAEISQ